MGAGKILESEDVGASGAVDAHGSGDLVLTFDAGEGFAGPDAEDGAHCEVGVHDARPVKWIERHAESPCNPYIDFRQSQK